MRDYDVVLTGNSYTYLAVDTVDNALFGDLWGNGLFRWNGDEMEMNCGSSETIASAPYCLWGQGMASTRGDGIISGVLAAGVDIGADKCPGFHRFVLRRRS